jgi:hypothetical protein
MWSDSEVGTRRETPVPVGEEHRIGDWIIKLMAIEKNADRIVLEEDEFNDPPVNGRRFVITTWYLKYVGPASGTPWVDLTFSYVGAAGNTFGSGSDDDCGVIPNDLSDVGEMFPNAEATGNECFSVPIEQIDAGVLMVEVDSVRAPRAFFATV